MGRLSVLTQSAGCAADEGDTGSSAPAPRSKSFPCARCDDCGHDYFVVYSCKGRGAVAFIHRFSYDIT